MNKILSLYYLIKILEKENALKQEEEKQTNDKLTLTNPSPTEKPKKCCS